MPAVIAADDANCGLPLVVGPVRQQTRETDVGVVAVEGGQKIDSVLSVSLVDRLGAFAGASARWLARSWENRGIGITGFEPARDRFDRRSISENAIFR
jgi:hypothetical protein